MFNHSACAVSALAIVALCPPARGENGPTTASAIVANDLTLNAVRPQMLDTPIANPTDEARERQPVTRPTGGFGTHTWELPAVNVIGESPLREEDLVGSYAQPRWTTDRRFSETRVYVIPGGKIEFEYWLIPTVARKGPSEIKNQYEVEIGFPGRIQMDLYLVTRKEESGGPTFVDQAIEFRYAFADWNKIWGNPTLYLEYTSRDQDSDLIESKLLLGGEIAPRWHWGADLSFEHAMGGDFYDEYEVTGGISYTVLDDKFSAGAEGRANFDDFHGHRGRFEHEIYLGPSFQYRPLPPLHVDFAPLIGLGHESPSLKAFLIVGWEF